MNLIRLGNKHVLKRYNCTHLRSAAQSVTRITTGSDSDPNQVVYGERALDVSIDRVGIAGGRIDEEDFDIASFFGEEPPIRITALASPAMIVKRLIQLFGQDAQFTEAKAMQMKEVMQEDLCANRKEEYMSAVGIALLFNRAGGHITVKMRDVIEKMELTEPHERNLITAVRVTWDAWDQQDFVQGDGALRFDSFYNSFMAPYIGSCKNDDTVHGLQAIDMDKNGYIDWNVFLVYLKWAIHEYPNIQDADELLSITFCKGIIPAMRREFLHK